MRSPLLRPGRLTGAALLLLVLGGGLIYLASARASTSKLPPGTLRAPAGAFASHLILGSKDGTQPQNMAGFLTAVTTNVDAYWTQVFQASGLPEPRVSYEWIPAGQRAASACGDSSGTLGDSAAAYCPGDDTIYISQKFASQIYSGALNQVLPGSSQGYGRAMGDFSVAYIVAHEYGHEVQDELGLFQQYGQMLPTMDFELQADCYAGNWAKSAYDHDQLSQSDVQSGLDTALAVGDFDDTSPQHHGTPQEREDAFYTGFQSGDPSACDSYLQA